MALSKEKQNFIESIAKLVQKYAPQYGIKVCSPIIAQAILESGWGESKLAAKYHNYFGLKCGSRWTGKSVNMKTQEEYTAGTKTTITDNFRVFDNMEEGVKGYFEFIHLARYQNLRWITDPKKYLETIKADGYATSSTYVTDTYKCVTTYGLTIYDTAETKKGDTSKMKTRSAVVVLAQSWIGKNESDGSHKSIIDIYNTYIPHPRGYKLQYADAWCASMVSALAIELGYTDIMPVECSCYYLIEAAKKMGIWQEKDSYVPSPADLILYDWDDSGSGDNTGNPDHVGVVEKVSGTTITVIEGNYSNSVKRRTIQVNGKYIRGFICPKYSDSTSSSGSTTNTSSISDSTSLKAGDKVTLKNTALYVSASSPSKAGTKTGTFYVWDSAVNNGRIRITNSSANVGKSGQVTGWVNISDISGTVANASSSSGSSSTSDSKPSYKVGSTYTLQVELKVRSGAGTNYVAKTHGQLTADGQKHDTDKDGALDKGTKVTCKAVKTVGSDIWMQIPSGWIAAYYQGNVYVK